jgi:hypothetical protein
MKTPENQKRKKSIKNSSSFELSAMRKLSSWENFLDLANVDLELVAKHKTKENEGARIRAAETWEPWEPGS